MAGRFGFGRSFAAHCKSSRKIFGREFPKFTKCSQQRKVHIQKSSSPSFQLHDNVKFAQAFQKPCLLRRHFPLTSVLLSKVQLAGTRLNSTVAAGIALASSDGIASSESSEASVEPLVDAIKTVPPDILTDSARDILSAVSEPTLESLGLGGYTPVGIIQSILQHLHVVEGLPWWAAIVSLTVVIRVVLFPLMIKGQVNAARLNAAQPEIERIQTRMRELANSQNITERAEVAFELQSVFKKYDCHPVKGLIVPIIQLPVFISFFLALRKMATLPVESMKEGGTMWFMDLTVYDPYYVLPVIASATMLAVLEFGAEAGVANQKNFQIMKAVFRFMTLAMIPITAKFPPAVFMYWITSNLFSLGQVAVLKVPVLRTYFGLPERPSTPVVPSKGGFWENMKAGYKSSQSAANIKYHEKQRRKQYEQLLKKTNERTFDYNPRIEKNKELFEMPSAKKTKRQS